MRAIILIIVFEFSFPILFCLSEICYREAESVRYYIYNYNIDVTVYYCSEKKDDYVEIGFLPANDTDIVERCIHEVYGANKSVTATKEYYLSIFRVKANLLEDSIQLPFSFNGKGAVNFTTGRYFDPSLNKTIIWFPDQNCTKVELIYNGLVDIWTFGGKEVQKYLLGRTAYSEFTLKLVKQQNTCKRDMWTTNYDGILVSSSRVSVSVIKGPESYRYISDFRSENLELLCGLLSNIETNFSEHLETEENKRLLDLETVFYLTIAGAVIFLWFVVTSMLGYTMNFLALRRSKRSGLHLVRCFSSTLTNCYLLKQMHRETKIDRNTINMEDYAIVDNDIYH